MTTPTVAQPPAVQIRALDDSNRAAVIEFIHARAERPRTADFEDWRYRDCPTMRASIAMVGDTCIGTMFALRRTYHTPHGDRELLEPFEWHSSESWRALAPGLRLVRQLMRAGSPIITVAGTDVAAGLLRRLNWASAGVVHRYALPLTGRFLASRGRGRLVSRGFDIFGRSYFGPRRVRGSAIRLEAASSYDPGLSSLMTSQRRFALMRKPDEVAMQWLQRSPAVVGQYVVLHARIGDELVGWVTGRTFSTGGIYIGELLEVFVCDDHRAAYHAIVAEASAMLASSGVDVLFCTTNCPDTTVALQRLRYRPDDSRPVFTWWGSATAPEGTALVDGAISDHAFFPVATNEERTAGAGSRRQR